MTAWRDRVGEHLGAAVVADAPLSGGCVGRVYRIDLEDGRRMVAKVDDAGMGGLDDEAWMLGQLAGESELPVPRVLFSGPGLLVMEHVEADGERGERGDRHAAELLASLHGIQGRGFGNHRDTRIGGLVQRNPWAGSWVAFFAEHRLVAMATEAVREGRLPRPVARRIEALAARLGEWLEEPLVSSLLHGDVWGGNVLFDRGRVAAFVDPATYYGHPEVELAFTTLFSTFGPEFYRRYHDLRGIAPGFFEERRDLYNLYPLLVHVRLFGETYLGGVERTLARFGE